jgi:hypothetical protein
VSETQVCIFLVYIFVSVYRELSASSVSLFSIRDFVQSKFLVSKIFVMCKENTIVLKYIYVSIVFDY